VLERIVAPFAFVERHVGTVESAPFPETTHMTIPSWIILSLYGHPVDSV